MLEKMGSFFDQRLEDYDEHQLNCIESARVFYPFTAQCLPMEENVRVLDLGCGTGIELESYFKLNPSANITGIDLAPGMLNRLKEKLANVPIQLILGSYFTVPFGENVYDAAVSVESLHYFTKEEKIPLYRKLNLALKEQGYFILTDYFALSDEEEHARRAELLRLKKLEGIADGEFYHYDTPLTVQHETEALASAGFASIEVLAHWGQTYTIKATKKA